MARYSFPSRRSFLGVLGIGAGSIAGAAQAQPATDTRQANVPTGMFRDRAPGAVTHPLSAILDDENFISAHRFMSNEEIADTQGYRGRSDLTRALQTALDAAWSTNRDLFIPAGLYRVVGLVLPGGQERRSRSFRVYGQGSGELFARAEDGGTIIKGNGPGPVLVNRQDRPSAGNGNQEVAYIRFEGNSNTPVLDFGTLYAQSELHHCGIYQSGNGDGVRVRHANTIEIHHNYVLNRDWMAPVGSRRTGCGIRVSSTNDSGLTTLRKNTARGFDWAIRLGGEGGGRMFSSRVEQCEASTCANGLLLDTGVDGAVVDNCYFEGGDGGVAIHNRGNGNTLTGNYVFPGFGVGVDDSEMSRATRIVGNTLSAGSSATIARGGCTLVRLAADTSAKTVAGNFLICDPVSSGEIEQVVGIELLGREPMVDVRGNTFDPEGDWGRKPGAAQFLDRSGVGGARGLLQHMGNMMLLSRGAISLGKVGLDPGFFAGGTLRLPPGSWFEMLPGARRTVRAIDSGAQDGRVVVLWDRNGLLTVEPSALVKLDGGRPFTGPGMITLLLQAEGGSTEALEISRTNY